MLPKEVQLVHNLFVSRRPRTMEQEARERVDAEVTPTRAEDTWNQWSWDSSSSRDHGGWYQSRGTTSWDSSSWDHGGWYQSRGWDRPYKNYDLPPTLEGLGEMQGYDQENGHGQLECQR